MTGMWIEVDVEELSGDDLAAALEAAAANESWDYRAAVGLVVEQRSWLYRYEFRQAVDAEVDEDGTLFAWVRWDQIDTHSTASSGELRILEVARGLGGIPSPRSLRDLLSCFDERNAQRVLRAFEITLRGTAS